LLNLSLGLYDWVLTAFFFVFIGLYHITCGTYAKKSGPAKINVV